MSKIYLPSGYPNIDYIWGETQNRMLLVGSRGCGKTYGVLKYLVEHREEIGNTIYLRRWGSQMDLCSSIGGNPFKVINQDLNMNIMPFKDGKVTYFYNSEIDEEGKVHKIGDAICVGMPLSTVANHRGVDFSDFDTILFDEFIPQKGEKTLPDEFSLFYNLMETVTRNRVIDGRPPIKVIMLGNSNTLNNPYYMGWDLVGRTVRMIAGGQMYYSSKSGNLKQILLLNSPIAEKKKLTALYEDAPPDFFEMAADSHFSVDATKIKSYNLREFLHVVSVGEVGIYAHKSRGFYYVSKTVDKSLYYQSKGFGLTQWRANYGLLKVPYICGEFIFESYQVEVIFRTYLDIK